VLGKKNGLVGISFSPSCLLIMEVKLAVESHIALIMKDGFIGGIKAL
jgi:hypothetical protein